MRSGLPPIPFEPTLPVLVRRAAERFGDDDYVVLADERISFSGAEAVSRALAKRMLASGIGKGTRVGIFLPTGIDWLVTWLAAARVGAIPMLFPSTYRPAELRRALRISDAALLVGAATMFDNDMVAFCEAAIPGLARHGDLPLRDPRVPFLRQIWLVADAEADADERVRSTEWATPVDVHDAAPPAVTDSLLAAVEAEVRPADPLLVIYTSGTSADPKAVVHTHGATIRKVQAELGMALPGSVPGRTFCAMPFFWVGGPQDLLGALHSGAAVVTQARFDIDGVVDLLERERCTSVLGWASVLEQIRAHPTYPERDLGALAPPPSGGPPMSSRGDPPNLGMTETFGPHANREWFDYKVVDPDNGAERTDGETGEFCVRGFGLMAGLYKQEREAVFDADGYYHTGDLGYVEDGRIWFTGRSSEMVKSGGANVAPLEVERVLESFADVRAAYVVGIDDAGRGQLVAAAVVPADGAHLDVDDLRARVNEQLSAYKVPRRWLVLDAHDVPWLGTGKPDKRSLRARFE